MFYDNYVQLCRERGEKPTPVAIKLGFVSSNVAQWKKGSTPRPAALQKIADYFGVTTAQLLGYYQKETPILKEDEQLDSDLIMRLCQLTPEEVAKVDAFVQGLLASR